MPYKDPQNYPIITYIWVLVLSLWGGTVQNVKKLRDGTISRFSIAEWVGDMSIAGFIGVITFYLCEYAQIPQVLSAVFIAVASHQGTRAIAIMERVILKRLCPDCDAKEILEVR